jgi:hypothetical protein
MKPKATKKDFVSVPYSIIIQVDYLRVYSRCISTVVYVPFSSLWIDKYLDGYNDKKRHF